MKTLMGIMLILSFSTMVLGLSAVLLLLRSPGAGQAVPFESVKASVRTPLHPVGGTASPYHNNDSWRWIQ
ncbi:MAG: hypothetical protein HS115_06615 [Spirochaetales bacterium]|nr:hypothetical protein [Spirochaetales bacterium]